jgi:hypothetical protein
MRWGQDDNVVIALLPMLVLPRESGAAVELGSFFLEKEC